jgi:hypothetical protein
VATFALWAIRIGRRLPLPHAVKAHLDRCLSIDSFCSAFVKNMSRINTAQVLGMAPLPILFSRGVEPIRKRGRRSVAGRVHADEHRIYIFDRTDGFDDRSKTLH